MDLNLSQLIINGNTVTSWQWTLGSVGTGGPQTLDANDFFGATANDNMYIDDYQLQDLNVVPVELISFTANVSGNNVNLKWNTATELNNTGFEVQRKSSKSEWSNIGFVQLLMSMLMHLLFLV